MPNTMNTKNLSRLLVACSIPTIAYLVDRRRNKLRGYKNVTFRGSDFISLFGDTFYKTIHIKNDVLKDKRLEFIMGDVTTDIIPFDQANEDGGGIYFTNDENIKYYIYGEQNSYHIFEIKVVPDSYVTILEKDLFKTDKLVVSHKLSWQNENDKKVLQKVFDRNYSHLYGLIMDNTITPEDVLANDIDYCHSYKIVTNALHCNGVPIPSHHDEIMQKCNRESLDKLTKKKL